MYLETNDLKTHSYAEVIDEISRGDEDIPGDAIKAAIAEAKGYLSAFDTEAEFNSEGDERNPILWMYVKDIALWHFINIANVNIDFDVREKRYKLAIEWLQKVQSGKTNPNLPLPPSPEGDNNFIKWGGNPPRGNYY